MNTFIFYLLFILKKSMTRTTSFVVRVLQHRNLLQKTTGLKSTCYGSIVLFLALLFPASAFSATVTFTQSSNPAGFVSQATNVESATAQATISAPLLSNGYRFTHWTLQGVRQADITGRALNRVSFTIYEHTDAVAHYLDDGIDSDADGVPDWFELHFYNTLANAPASDTDGDGISLLEEFRRDTHANLSDSFVEGGVSRASTEVLQLIFNPAYCFFKVNSIPAGFVSSSTIITKGTTHSTPVKNNEEYGWRFAYWTVNGIRQADTTGSAKPQATVTVNADTVATAHYFRAAEDTDGDSIPDWYEWKHYGALAQTPSSDTDGDGVSLLEEFRQDTHPCITNSVIEGGVSRASSELFSYTSPAYFSVVIKSDPAGFVITDENFYLQGSSVTTPNQHGLNNGYYFIGWYRDGVRQADTYGNPLSRVTISVNADTELVARYLDKDTDSDGDGISDWYESYHYGSLANAPQSDTDGDGVSLLEEYRQDSNPLMKDNVLEGGISRASSEALNINLQIFERLRWVKVAGVLNPLFTDSLTSLTGQDFGSNVSVALCDWDGDGDLDAFIAHSAGLAVYENTGSRYNPNLEDRTERFSALSTLVGGVTRPAVSTGDWNGDGRVDIVLGGQTNTLHFIASSGHFLSGQPGSASLTLNTGSAVSLPALGVLDSVSGRTDLAVVLDNGTVRRYPHNGSGVPFSNATFTNDILGGVTVPRATSIALARVDTNATLDVLVSDADGRVWEFFNNGNGTSFTLKSKVWGGTGDGFAEDMVLSTVDWDADTDTDAAIGRSDGAFMLLRDPRLGPPQGLTANGGATSAILNWDPDRSSRVKGYRVYRQIGLDPFVLLNQSLSLLPEYEDSGLANGVAYHYYVTAVAETFFPGNSVPRMVESSPSQTVTVHTGTTAGTSMNRYGKAGQSVFIPLRISNSKALSANMEIRLVYDKNLLTPVRVYLTKVTGNVTITTNAASNTGTLIITGSGGSMSAGVEALFTVEFGIKSGAVLGTTSSLAISFPNIRDVNGYAVTIPANNVATTVRYEYGLGDVNGDGVFNDSDKAKMRDLMKKNAPAPTADELSAGDYDGNGKIDNKDYLYLTRHAEGKTVFE